MTNDHTDHQTNPHLTDDPELRDLEARLDLLAGHDRRAMPTGLESRVLDAISATIAPTPVPINSSSPSSTPAPTSGRFWSLRLAAAGVLAAGTTLLIVSTHPWANNAGINTPTITLTAFETDLDTFFDLESEDQNTLSQAVTEWEIWAQSIDTEIDSSMIGLDLPDPTQDNGAL